MSVTSPYQPSTGDRRNGQPAGAAALPGSPPSSGGPDRLPRPPRRRRPGFAALAVLLVVGAAAAAGLLAVRLDERVPILVAAEPIQAGAEITRSDLATARVASSDLRLISASDANAVVGRYATQSIPAGRPLDADMLTRDSPLVEGNVALGIPLTANNVPSGGVKAGDRVKVYAVKDGVGKQLTSEAIVYSISSEEKGGAFGGGGGGDKVATILIKDDEGGQLSASIAAAAVSGQAALGIAERDAVSGQDEG
jgi:hypothetical protein